MNQMNKMTEKTTNEQKEFCPPGYEPGELKYKEHQEQKRFYAIRYLINDVKSELASSKRQLVYAVPRLAKLYIAAAQSNWGQHIDPSLKNFIYSYLTTEEKELFDISYPHWMVETVEYTIVNEV